MFNHTTAEGDISPKPAIIEAKPSRSAELVGTSADDHLRLTIPHAGKPVILDREPSVCQHRRAG